MTDSQFPNQQTIQDSPLQDRPTASEMPVGNSVPSQSISDRLSYFSDYLSEYPNRIPAGLKSFVIFGVMTFGTISGILLLRQNLDVRKQASEGNKALSICKTEDPKVLLTKKIANSTGCLLKGKTYYLCDEDFTLKGDKCVGPSK